MKNKRFKFLCTVLSVILALFVFVGCDDKDKTVPYDESSSASSENENGDAGLKQFDADKMLSGKHHVSMELKDLGTVVLELDADEAPITVTNFCELAKSGFYNGLTFHRVLPGTLIQGGDPDGTGTGGPGYNIKGEFKDNEVDNNLSHTAGAISMARSMDFDSAGSQFFICAADCSYYDGQYAAFGHVTEGLQLIEQLCNTVPVQDNNGTVADADKPIISKVTVID